MSEQNIDPEDFLNEGGGYPAFKFPAEGDTLDAELVSAKVGNERVYGSSEPARWPDGSVKRQLQLVAVRDREKSKGVKVGDDDDTDTGVLYCKYSQKEALKDACAEAGIKLSGVGRIRMQRGPDAEPTKKGNNPAHTYRAKVWPKVDTSADDLDDWD